MAIDREELETALFPPGVGTLDWAPHRSWKGVYIPFDELTETAKMVLTYDPEAAKALLAEAGYPDGFKTKIQYHAVGSCAIPILPSGGVPELADGRGLGPRAERRVGSSPISPTTILKHPLLKSPYYYAFLLMFSPREYGIL